MALRSQVGMHAYQRLFFIAAQDPVLDRHAVHLALVLALQQGTVCKCKVNFLTEICERCLDISKSNSNYLSRTTKSLIALQVTQLLEGT
jgi:hypothetical protein